eukprot:CAMPEP_0168529394 /NCGR_PEP_ID=MMETSP0405-20121227/13887_1 /TAXON_ID=498012 /ORGANISM="Trichosphaerium sp, Strain Am-I-7 wt" /LENGTH=102 /DNA_ID=CAMNT_0008553119 /DNA_START=10 /DNA_END=318 /DNA_ORIENTATION=-
MAQPTPSASTSAEPILKPTDLYKSKYGWLGNKPFHVPQHMKPKFRERYFAWQIGFITWFTMMWGIKTYWIEGIEFGTAKNLDPRGPYNPKTDSFEPEKAIRH